MRPHSSDGTKQRDVINIKLKYYIQQIIKSLPSLKKAS
jgi:hypothetical protein